MVRVLVAVASKHGATWEIGEALGQVFAERGLRCDVLKVEDVQDVTDYDAVVLGSAVYFGRWMESARRFADAFADDLSARPVWLFSSGPIGDPPRPSEEVAVNVDDLLTLTGATGHRLFAGRIDKDQLSFSERAVLAAVRSGEGDFRDWIEIAGWADTIAHALDLRPA